MIHLLHGTETYRIDLAVKKIVGDAEVTEVEKLDDEAAELLRTPSFFGMRCVILRKDVLGAEEELFSLLQSQNFPNDLLIVAKNCRANTKFYRWLIANADVVACGKLDRPALEAYICKGVAKYDARITEKAVERLVENSGYLDDPAVDLYTIQILVRQCTLSATEITPDIVDDILPERVDERAWDLIELLTGGKIKECMVRANELAQASEPMMVLGILLRYYRIAYKVAVSEDEKYSEIVNKTGVNASQLTMICRMLPRDRKILFDAMEMIMHAVEQIKNGDSMPRTALLRAVAGLVELQKKGV